MHTSLAGEAFIGLLNVFPSHSSQEKYNPSFEEAGLPLLISAKDSYRQESFLHHHEVGLWGVR